MNVSNRTSQYSSPENWTQPLIINPADHHGVESILDSGEVQSVHDNLPIIEKDLRSAHVLSRQDDVEERTRWVHFPWTGQLIRYPDEDAHYQLRTYRNRPVITKDEQHTVRDARIAFFGLSVGSRIVQQVVESGTGNSYLLADPDSIEPTNLNRMQATMEDVGEPKVSYVAKSVSKKDPYVSQLPLYDGYVHDTPNTLDVFRPNIIVEEVDDIAVKAMVRQYAAEKGIPVIMVTDLGEKSIVDVERYDLDAKTRPFHGALSSSQLADLADGRKLSKNDHMKAAMKVAGGIRNIPPRLVRAAYEMKRGEIGGIPQLGRTAAAGAVYADMVIQDILLGRQVPTGRSISMPRQTIGLSRVDALKDTAGIYWNFLRSQKS